MWRQCGPASQIQPALPACLVKGRLVMVALYVVCFCLYVECWGWQLSLWRIFASTNNTPPQKKYVDKTQFLPPLSTKFYQIKMKKINSSFYLYSFFIVHCLGKNAKHCQFSTLLESGTSIWMRRAQMFFTAFIDSIRQICGQATKPRVSGRKRVEKVSSTIIIHYSQKRPKSMKANSQTFLHIVHKKIIANISSIKWKSST